MLTFLRTHIHLFALILVWVITTVYLGPLIYIVLPASIFLLRRGALWAEMVFGFLIILILSDMPMDLAPMAKIKSAKYGMMIALGLLFLFETRSFQPVSRVFTIFLPFFAYSLFPLIQSNDPLTGLSKTLSYMLLYLVIPNYVLLNIRRQGWAFMRDLIFFIITLLIGGYLVQFVNKDWVVLMGRFRGIFGNPNGLGLFCYLAFMLAYLVNYMKKDLFTRMERVLIFGVLIFFIIKSGSRSALVAASVLVLFAQFFRLSPFLGLVGLVAFVGVVELISSNLVAIVSALGLQDYLRVDTIESGSGRYFAWEFAWDQINKGGYLLIGGGFGNDEYIMRKNFYYLIANGHQGGVHNSYLTLWFNTGIVGVLLFLRSYILMFINANRNVPIAFAIMFSTLFSVMYESWLAGSLNPFTIILVIAVTLLTEPDIVNSATGAEDAEAQDQVEADVVPAGA